MTSTTNLTDLTCTSMTIGTYALPAPVVQTLTDSGAITIKHGIVRLNKAGAIAATLAMPTAGTDDYKRLLIVAITAQAHTVTCAEGFGNPTADCVVEGEDVGTYASVIGNSMNLLAYNGVWYITNLHGVTVA